MTPIHELLSRIRWDKEFGRGRFEIGYFDRYEAVVQQIALQDVARAEWGVMPNADNFLHEAALADDPPSGTFYAPNGDGVSRRPLPSPCSPCAFRCCS